MSRLADVLATLRDAAEAIAPAAVEERREHVENILLVIFGDFPRKAPRTAQEALAVVREMRAEGDRLRAEIENLRAEVATLRAKGPK